ncbi:TetR/AcrR family transcriptional regulator [Shouchella clausii]|uniref:TetR/AcrR family transcriptional regulator n=1 Tax=Shouchella clausii TaxID=79880 RepID=UPI0031FD00B3
MTAKDIKAAAFKFFSRHGYEGASLSQIAHEAGIKKQSIYTHFDGKDDLFMQVVHDVAELELDMKRQLLGDFEDEAFEQQLFRYVSEHKRLVEEDERFFFWLRISFFPPVHLYDAVEEIFMRNEEQIERLIYQLFAKAIKAKRIGSQNPETPTLAFMALLDALAIELVYGADKERIKKKTAAGWAVFWRGIMVGEGQ